MTFEEYLTKRRVNVPAFAAGEPQRFAEWQDWYSQMHPESFYTMVKMVLNDVRRNYWLAEVPKPVAAAVTETFPDATTTPARPAGRRAAISRPAAVTSETPKAETSPEEILKPATEISETKPAETGTTSEETIAKPARPVFKPRAVIKKPAETATDNNLAPDNPEIVKPSAAKPAAEINPEQEKPAAENSEAAPVKPARPRAVIRRPAALTNPETKPEETTGNSAPESIETPKILSEEASETAIISAEKLPDENTPETPKPARPRPIFKHPASPATALETSSAEQQKTVAETPQKLEANSEPETPIENPVAKPGQEGASEAKAVSEEIHDNPEAAKAAEEVSAAVGHVPQPPRPRPVFKRPAIAVNPPENISTETQKTVSETAQKPEEYLAALQPETLIEKAASAVEKPAETIEKTVGNSDEKVEEPAPKPPRPRPVFKRPAKPEDTSDTKDI